MLVLQFDPLGGGLLQAVALAQVVTEEPLAAPLQVLRDVAKFDRLRMVRMVGRRKSV